MANHSCIPNAVVSFHKRNAFLRAESPIQKGEEVTISYVGMLNAHCMHVIKPTGLADCREDYTKPRSFRQQGLDLYHFQCACPRCTDNLDIYEVCRKSPLIDFNSLSLLPDLEKFRDPPIAANQVALATLKDKVDSIYSACRADAQNTAGGRLPHLQFQWRQCQPFVHAGMWATEPLGSLIENAVIYYMEQASFAHALSVACLAALRCDPYKHVAPFKQWRLKGIIVIAKLLTNTAPAPAMAEMAKISHPGVMGVLTQADQVSICQALLLMVVHYGPMAHSGEWEILSLAKTMLEDIERLGGRERESALLQGWLHQEIVGTVYFRTQVLKPIEDLAGFAVDILALDLESRSGMVPR